MTEALQLLISGSSQGLIYSLLAIGYNITFSTSRTVDFSLGTVLMAGGVVGFIIYVDAATGLPYGRTFVLPFLGVLIAGTALGTLIFQVAIRPALKSRVHYASILSTLAVGLLLRNLVTRWWSSDDFKFPSPFGDSPIRILGAGIYPQELAILVFALLIAGAVEYFKHKTIWGKSVQAVSEDAEMASLLGINPSLIIRFAFIISAILAAVAGVLVAPITLVSATMGNVIGIKAYAAAIIGGLESTVGALIGGLFLGLCEAFTARYISSGYREMTGFLILILVLVFKPNGLFARGTVRRV